MLDQEDLKWIATTSTQLNTMLQQISRYADLARQHKGDYNYVDLLGERVEFASKTAQSLFDRITSRILQGSAPKTKGPPDPCRAPEFTVVPPPSKAAPSETTTKGAPEKSPAHAKTPAAEGKTPAAKPSSIPADIKVLKEKGNRELILLVEDESDVAELASAMLTDEGYKVIIAHDGFEALRIYQQISKQIGLVILDFFLPVMDGDAVFDELCALNPDVAVVLSSGFAEQSKLGSMLARGLRGFIPKPYSPEKLLAQVRSTLDSARDSSR
jgi:CheY-like chemotaxis protein